MENTAQRAVGLLRNQMTGDDLHQLSDTELFQLEAICHHWQKMAESERKHRAQTPKIA